MAGTEPSWPARNPDPQMHGWPEPLPPLRLTRLGRQALAITLTAAFVLAFAVGFLIRTPLDRAVADCGDISAPCQMPHQPALIHPTERTP